MIGHFGVRPLAHFAIVSEMTPVSRESSPIEKASVFRLPFWRMNRTSCSCSCYRMHAGAMEINERWTDARSGSVWFALWGGMAGAIAASACCILPLALFGAGVSGAWIGNFTQLSPWQPYFIAATLLCLGS